MACGSCGQKRQTMTQSQAAAMNDPSRKKAVYYVTDPATGERSEFNDYLQAVTFKKKVNGTLTTTTG